MSGHAKTDTVVRVTAHASFLRSELAEIDAFCERERMTRSQVIARETLRAVRREPRRLVGKSRGDDGQEARIA